MIFFLFFKKKVMKNQMQIFFIVIISFPLFKQFSLTIEHRKSEVFHFSRSTKNLSSLGGSLLQPKNNWRYLRFIFNRKLSFCQHICYHSNKALLSIKGIKILGNSTKGLLASHKLLYRMYIIHITLYGFSL